MGATDYSWMKELERRITISEGCSATRYLDSRGIPTIGIGFNLQRADTYGALLKAGVAPTMAVGFGLGDLLHHYLLRHVSQGTRNTADAIQALSNVAGIMQTNGNRGGFVPRVPPPTLTPVSGPPGAPPPPPLPPGQKP